VIQLGFELVAVRQHLRLDSIGFHLLKWNGDPHNSRSIATSVSFAPFADGEYTEPRPLFEISSEGAQRLIDALWQCGLRPTQGKQSEGVTAAQARHLEDMRALTFAKLGIERP
jgi:hypothetical protein